jgi:hypothetical protein
MPILAQSWRAAAFGGIPATRLSTPVAAYGHKWTLEIPKNELPLGRNAWFKVVEIAQVLTRPKSKIKKGWRPIKHSISIILKLIVRFPLPSQAREDECTCEHGG